MREKDLKNHFKNEPKQSQEVINTLLKKLLKTFSKKQVLIIPIIVNNFKKSRGIIIIFVNNFLTIFLINKFLSLSTGEIRGNNG